MTGLATGVYKDLTDISQKLIPILNYTPCKMDNDLKYNIRGWHNAVKKCIKN